MLMTDVKGSKLKLISDQFVGCISNNSVILNQQAGPHYRASANFKGGLKMT